MAKLSASVYDGVRIAAISATDVKELFELMQDPLIKKYIPEAYKTEGQLFESVYRTRLDTDYYTAIFDDTTNEMVGGIIATAYPGTTEILNLSIFTKASNRKMGYMRKALIAFKNAMPPSHTLIFRVLPDNYPSINTVSKIIGIKEVDVIPGDPYREFHITT